MKCLATRPERPVGVTGTPVPAKQFHPMPTLLVVDDSDALLDRVQEILLGAGFQVVVASSGFDAIKLLHRVRFDLIVTDIYMADGDGYDVLQAVRKSGKKIPIIAMSANPVEFDSLGPAKMLGACGSLWKPFSAVDLLNMVMTVLAGVRAASVERT